MGTDLNGKTNDIHDNVIHIRGSLSNLETTLSDLARSVHHLADAYQTSAETTEQIVKHVMGSNERTIEHVKNALPLRIVAFLCAIICVAFVGGGILKELVDSHVLVKMFGG